MSRKIMVPLDGSVLAESALPMALAVAGPEDTIELVTVVEPTPPFGPRRYAELALEWAEDYLADTVKRIEGPHPDIETTTIVGRPVIGLVEKSRGADLVVMATHGRGVFTRAWLGSVADAMLRAASSPVLLVAPSHLPEERAGAIVAGRKPTRALVALDGSELAEAGLDTLLDLLPETEDVTLLRAVRYPYVMLPPYSPDILNPTHEIFKDVSEDATRYLAGKARELKRRGVKPEKALLVSEHPAHTITDYADEHEVDVIAIATHGHGGLKRLALGSVADKVVRTSNVPVLVHRPEGPVLRTAVDTDSAGMAASV